VVDILEQEVVLPPQSKEAEEAVVGALMLNAPGLDEIGYLEEGDFYFSVPRAIWRAIQKLREQKISIDYLTVLDRLEKNGDLESAGGPAGLAAIINNVSSFNINSYARIVKEKSQRRVLLDQANRLAQVALDESQPVDEGIGKILDKVVTSAASADKGLRSISTGLKNNYEYVEKRRLNPSKIWGIKTGFYDFDEFTGGAQLSEVIYISGPPASGKTKLAIQMAVQAALPENGSHPVGIFSFEMNEAQIIKRIVSGRKHISTFQMDSGNITDDVFQNYLADIEYLEALPIYISDKTLTPQEFHAELARAKNNMGLELFVLDYLLMMGGYQDMDETPRSSLLSRMVKQSAMELNLAGITVLSTTKDIIGSTATPTSRDVRGSAQVIFDADIIAILSQCSEPGKQNVSNLIFTKTRNIARPISKIELINNNIYPIFDNATEKTIDFNHIV
jgi:replicative DNA helicase